MIVQDRVESRNRGDTMAIHLALMDYRVGGGSDAGVFQLLSNQLIQDIEQARGGEPGKFCTKGDNSRITGQCF